WKFGLVVNGMGAVVSLIVDVVIAITKFTHGAWVIIALVPVMVVFLVRLARQYELEAQQLEHDVPDAVAAPIMRRHVVLVFVDRLDLAAARAIQYGRVVMPDELRVVHFAIDQHAADQLAEEWLAHGTSNVPLDLVECPDRRITRAAVEAVARELTDGQTEVSVLLPDRKYRGVWHRILHDQTADEIVREVSRLPHANVTAVPFHLDTSRAEPTEITVPVAVPAPAPATVDGSSNGNGRVDPGADGHVRAIGSVGWRQHTTVEGRIRTLRVQRMRGTATLECVLEDETGAASIVFLGRTLVPGIEVGARVRVRGTLGQHHGRLAILNPEYELLPR
ncbi:MAG: hypothetical protein JO291_01215, partial [Acidimicrobiia bacterium]|nr:hypothetical protein [Acidimicrobiia bacterium]